MGAFDLKKPLLEIHLKQKLVVKSIAHFCRRCHVRTQQEFFA
jgi:hypothetical protein